MLSLVIYKSTKQHQTTTQRKEILMENTVFPCEKHHGAIMRLENFERAIDIATDCPDCEVAVIPNLVK